MSADLNTLAENSSFLAPHHYSGRLIAAEGLDGSGKSTQLQLLGFWLRAEGYEAVTAFARDAARGLDLVWIHNLYHFAISPDIVFYLHINPQEAVRRRLALQEQPKDVHKDDKGQSVQPLYENNI